MHYAKILLPLLAVIVFVFCKKDDYYWGTVTCQKNGVPWPGHIRATISTISDYKINIVMNTLDEEGNELETLVFFKVPMLKGKYSLSYTINQPPDDSLIGCDYANGYLDQLYDSYLLAQQDSSSYLEITEYNDKKQEIKGRFNLIVWPDIKGSLNAPDSIVFANGEFHTKIIDR
ncbi:MAG: hypothetical protein JNJ57_20330 [Saprospiraceae bacterium]|nr:hypothetical protein [Saprospiraceae bacterium]